MRSADDWPKGPREKANWHLLAFVGFHWLLLAFFGAAAGPRVGRGAPMIRFNRNYIGRKRLLSRIYF
jgi:hypothetical protein